MKISKIHHVAFEVESLKVLTKTKARLEANGHRIELTTNTSTPEMSREFDNVKWDMLNEWSEAKIAPEHARWMHDRTYD